MGENDKLKVMKEKLNKCVLRKCSSSSKKVHFKVVLEGCCRVVEGWTLAGVQIAMI